MGWAGCKYSFSSFSFKFTPIQANSMQLAPVKLLGRKHWRPLRPSYKPFWLCKSCLVNQQSSRRWNSSAQTQEKPFYVTTPIFYVNAAPHIGHLYCAVLADVAKRWQQINGKQVYMLTGTDEHGMKIQRAAEKEGVDTKAFCDANSNKFQDLMNKAGVSHDFFSRTTDPDHKDAVAQFWLQLKHGLPERLGLYKKVHEGWYCVSDECFYSEKLVRTSIVPQTGKKIVISVESENEVEWVKEETWMFPLTKYKDQLLEFYDKNPNWVHPPERMRDVRYWVENRLEDLSVTRPATRLKWGISDPEDSSQTIYVWVDALLNYITKAGYGSSWRGAGEDTGIWPADLQIIGKDILRFHAIYWPALLMSLNLPLPKRLICHNHWTMSNRKMSKSLGNVVNPFFALQRWDVDPLRYFLMRKGNFAKDMDYSNETFGVLYLKELQSNLGNLFYRVLKPKSKDCWSTEDAVTVSNSGAFKKLGVLQGTVQYDQYFLLDPFLEKVKSAFSRHMENYNTSGAINEVFELLLQTNRYITECEPWSLLSLKDTQSRLLVDWIIYRCAEALRIAGILLQPIMPSKTKRLLDEMNVRADRRTVDYASPGADDAYGTINDEKTNFDRHNKHLLLFPPSPSADLDDLDVLRDLRDFLEQKHKSTVNQVAALMAMDARIPRGNLPKDMDLPERVPKKQVFLKTEVSKNSRVSTKSKGPKKPVVSEKSDGLAKSMMSLRR